MAGRTKPLESVDDLPPHDLAAEEMVIGCMLADAQNIPEITAVLKDSDFYFGTYRALFALCVEAADKTPLDGFSAEEPLRLRVAMSLEEARKLVGECVRVAFYPHLGSALARVLQTSNRRRYLQAAADLVLMARDTQDDAEIGERALERIQAIVARAKRSRPEPISAAELEGKQLPPVRYIIPQYLPQGGVLLHSRPKAGKTRLADSLAWAAASGGLFLGKIRTPAVGVLCLYLEDTEQSAQERFRQIAGDVSWPERLSLIFAWKRLHEGGYADLDDYLGAHVECKLVVIDTLQMIRPPRSKDDIYGDDVAVLRRFKDLADKHGAAVVVLHHSKKGSQGDDLIDSAGGTSGNTGSMDTVMRLRRIPGSDEAILEGRGRKVRDFELAIRLDDRTGWQLLGDAAEVHRSSEEREVLDLLAAEPMRPQDIASELGISGGTGRQRLRRMAQRGLIVRSRSGWYSLAASDNAVTPVTAITAITPVIGVQVSRCNVSGPNGAVGASATDATPVTGVTGDTGATAVTGVTGVSAPQPTLPDLSKGLPLDLDFCLETDEVETRQNVWRLAWAHGYPALDLGGGIVIEAGADPWQGACRNWFLPHVTRAGQALEARR